MIDLKKNNLRRCSKRLGRRISEDFLWFGDIHILINILRKEELEW